MKTILFPTDFSEASVTAVSVAVDLARLLSARIVFVYAVRSFADRDKFIASAAFDNETEAEAALRTLTGSFSQEVSCQYQVRTGIVSDEIASAAREAAADILVMATSGAGDIPDTLAILNSTTTELISKRICPVLAVPAGARLTSFRKIVLAIDPEPVVATSLALLSQITRETKAEILLLTVLAEKSVSGDDILANKNTTIESVFSGLPYSVHAVQSEDTIDSIQQFASQQHADLIAVVSRKRGVFDLLFRESVSQKLALHSQVPLLVIPEE